MNYLLPERLDRLAREYALGTLHGGARRRFEKLVRSEPAAAQAVFDWQERLATLAASVPPLEPTAAVWMGLEQRLFERPVGVPAAPPRRAGGWAGLASGLSGWLSMRPLRGVLGGLVGGVVAGALACALVLQQQPQWLGHEVYRDALPPSYVGLLTTASGQAAVLASSRRHGRSLTVKLLQPLAIPPGSVAQLWALPKDGSAPFPVGSVPAQGSATIALTDTSEKLFAQVVRLAVSFEHAPASSGAQPTGAFVLSGHCVKLW